MSDIFTTRDARNASGLSFRQIDELARRGLVEPNGLAAQGKGSRRMYRRADLILLRAAGMLRQAGIVGAPFIRALDELRRLKPDDMPGQLLVLRASKIAIVPAGKLADDLKRLDDCAVILPLRELGSARQEQPAPKRRQGARSAR